MLLVTFHNQIVSLYGKPLKVGDNAPSVELISNDLSHIAVGGIQDKYQIINVVPSLDTGACARQIVKFNQKCASMPNVKVFSVSMDLPFAQKHFCYAHSIENVSTVSDYRLKEFGKAYGLLLESSSLNGLLARAVILVDKRGKIIYQEIAKKIEEEPNYDAAIFALQKAIKENN